jgi:hypothetical protein
MKRHRRLFGGLLGLALAVVLSCAPIQPPSEDDLLVPSDGSPTSSGTDQSAEKPEIPSGLKARLEAAIKNVRQRDLLTTNAFWTIFHGILGLGPGVELVDPATKQRVNALDYITSGNSLRGLVFRTNIAGAEVVTTGDSLGQGHQDQFIAEMAQWNMPADRKFLIQGREFTFLDFVNLSQMKARTTTNQELSWTIIVVAQYRGTDVEWTNFHHEKIHFEDVVRYELNQSVENAACGGTHRLFGLSWAYHLHLQRGGKNVGVWQEIPKKVAQYKELARRYQNADGSLSTSFFRGPGNEDDKNRRINTTGHMVEWAALAFSDDELREPWLENAVNALCLDILDLQGAAIDGGSMYHAVHGLILYYARVFGRNPEIVPPQLLCPVKPGWKKV